MNVQFKVREKTVALITLCQDLDGITRRELYKKARRNGDFDVSFHYFINSQGIVETGREEYVVAGYDLDHSRQAVVVLIDSPNGILTDSQKVSLKDIEESLEGTYPEIVLLPIDILED